MAIGILPDISTWSNAKKEVVAFTGAEFASIGMAIGAFTFLDEIAPSMMKTVSKAVSKVCVEPYLDSIERGLNKYCRSQDCIPDYTKSREERAEGYAHYLSRFGISALISIGSEVAIRNGLASLLKIKHPASNLHVTGMDKVSHLALIGLFNTVGARQTDSAIGVVSNILQKTLGWSKERAHRAADATIRWELPNWGSWLITSSFLISRNGKNKS